MSHSYVYVYVRTKVRAAPVCAGARATVAPPERALLRRSGAKNHLVERGVEHGHVPRVAEISLRCFDACSSEGKGQRETPCRSVTLNLMTRCTCQVRGIMQRGPLCRFADALQYLQAKSR